MPDSDAYLVRAYYGERAAGALRLRAGEQCEARWEVKQGGEFLASSNLPHHFDFGHEPLCNDHFHSFLHTR